MVEDSLPAVPAAFSRVFRFVGYQAQAWLAGFPFSTEKSWGCGAERMWRAPLHHLVTRCRRFKAVAARLAFRSWELGLSVLELAIELVLVAYRLVVVTYRMLVGMVNEEKQESSVPDLIQASGYKVETHAITTQDGYILDMHRIPSTGKPVLLMHGMLCNSYCWVTSDTNSLAFLLSDAGYDVWLGNFRGTKYSRKHETLDPDKDLEFWRFTMHEMGDKDLSAMISNVISISGKPSLSYIGHSMGTTCFLILASTKPWLVEKVNLAILMAPVVELHNSANLVLYLAPLHKLYRWIVETVGILEILPASLLIEKLTWDAIGHQCLKLKLRGPNLSKEDDTMLKRICHHARTSRTSIYTILHYAQNITNQYFHAYDWYDKVENFKRYGCEEPPIYDISQVSVPSAIFWSSNDTLSSKEDMERIVSELPNIVSCKEVNIGHLDYLWGANVKGDLYYDLLDLLARQPLQTPLVERVTQALTTSRSS
eukprot:GFUD01044642.1.p1 GENE.GFUD01044642.1~~GFUD01044642.1.p1  ORF type:complete len:482 (+),score=83.26 GFUD01044642.1:272-1717(+)